MNKQYYLDKAANYKSLKNNQGFKELRKWLEKQYITAIKGFSKKEDWPKLLGKLELIEGLFREIKLGIAYPEIYKDETEVEEY